MLLLPSLPPAPPDGVHLVHLPGLVSARAMDASLVSSRSMEQGGGVEGAEIQAAVGGKGNQTGLTVAKMQAEVWTDS